MKRLVKTVVFISSLAIATIAGSAIQVQTSMAPSVHADAPQVGGGGGGGGGGSIPGDTPWWGDGYGYGDGGFGGGFGDAGSGGASDGACGTGDGFGGDACGV